MAATSTETLTSSPQLTNRRGVQRDLTAARAAFACADGDLRRELSREAHGLLAPEPGSPQLSATTSTWSPWLDASEAGHNEELAHRGVTLFLRGGVDGLMTSLLCLSIGDAAGWPASMTVSLSAAVVGCWATYMGCREALEHITYKSYYSRERQREAWELDNFPEGEVEEMLQLYVKKGLAEGKARAAIGAMAASPEFFVDLMMLEELNMAPPPDITSTSAAIRVCSGALLGGGLLLLLQSLGHQLLAAYVAPTVLAHHMYWSLLAFAIVGLGYLGALRASITHQRKRYLAMQTIATALLCVMLARSAGSMLHAHLQPTLLVQQV